MDINNEIKKDDEDVDYVKRYLPIYGIGSFLCCDCIVDAAKDYILDEFPEVTYYKTHTDDEDQEELTEVAIKCLLLLGKKFLPENSGVFFLDAENLLNHCTPGTIFIGCNYDGMGLEERKIDYLTRVSELLLKLNIFNPKKEDNQDNQTKGLQDSPKEFEDHDHEIQEFEVDILSDVFVSFSEKRNEDDKDDLDIGYENGISAGIDQNYELVQVALYKMFKKKKIKNLDFILEELHDTIAGMDSEDMILWHKKFANYMDKKKQKDSMLEMGDE